MRQDEAQILRLWEVPMAAQISPMLAVQEPAAAIDFYKRALGAVEVWTLGDPDPIVACVSIEDAELFLAKESPNLGERSTRSPRERRLHDGEDRALRGRSSPGPPASTRGRRH
jgi:hypothetical protein